MKFRVKPNRLNIRVDINGKKSVAFPGEWASNFSINEKGELIRKDFENKFYVDEIKNLFWDNGEIPKKLDDVELSNCIQAIKDEANKSGWKIIWPI